MLSSIVNWYNASSYFVGSGRTRAGSIKGYHNVDNFSVTKTGARFERQTPRWKTVNNLLRPLFLPAEGHTMARAIDWGPPRCTVRGQRGPAGICTASNPDPKEEAQAEKGELGFAVLDHCSQKIALVIRSCTAAFTLPELQAKVFQVPGSNIRHVKCNILIYMTT